MTKQVVVFIHGIGDQKEGYSDKCRDRIEKEVRNLLNRDAKTGHAKEYGDGPISNIEYREVYWADVTNIAQQELRQTFKGIDLDYKGLRNVVIGLLGDAIAYQRTEGATGGIYYGIHNKIWYILEGCEDIEYTFVCHSLGTVIASNFLYDYSIRSDFPITNLFTLGSPLALWLIHKGSIVNADSPVRVDKDNGVWLNLLDKDDVIAYPLKCLNKHYNDAVDADVFINTGWTPLSHTGYWDDKEVIRPVAKKLFLDYMRINHGKEFDKREYLEAI